MSEISLKMQVSFQKLIEWKEKIEIFEFEQKMIVYW